jgi:hypothetical protein
LRKGPELTRLAQVRQRTGGVSGSEFHRASCEGRVGLQCLGTDMSGHLVKLGRDGTSLVYVAGGDQDVDCRR